jgi:hypothetical protein
MRSFEASERGGQTVAAMPIHAGAPVPVAVLYCLAAASLLPCFHYSLNPDGVSYISIAEKYLRGEFLQAVNSFWSPLYSWLLLPLMAAGVEPIIAARLISILAGLAALAGAMRLAGRIGLDPGIRLAVLIGLAPAMLLFAFSCITPDLLATALLLWYFSSILDPGYARNRRAGLICGLLGGFAYLAKAYSFWFYLIHFPLMHLLHGMGTGPDDWKALRRNFLAGLAVFALLAGTWVGMLGLKYGRLTVSTAGTYNFARLHPDSYGSFYLNGLHPPPDSGAASIMEDPRDLPVGRWSPLESPRSFGHLLESMARNAYDIFLYMNRFTPLAAAVLLGAVLLIAAGGPGSQQRLAGLLATMLVYPSGYLVFIPQERYVWVLASLLAVAGGLLLQALLAAAPFRGRRPRVLALLFFVMSFMLLPARELPRIARDRTGEDIHRFAGQLASQPSIQGNFASDGEWGKSLILTYHLRSRYFGTASGQDEKSLGNLLDGHGIDYFLVWDSRRDLSGREDITRGVIPGLRVFPAGAGGPVAPVARAASDNGKAMKR